MTDDWVVVTKSKGFKNFHKENLMLISYDKEMIDISDWKN